MTDFITLIKPDDWHVHLRQGGMLGTVLSYTARQFGRAIVMPNLKPPVTTTEQAVHYQEQILQALPSNSNFCPLMTLYLTDSTAPEEIIRAKQTSSVVAAKLYPANATTNSEQGVSSIEKIFPVFEEMEKQGFILLVHGEVSNQEIDIFDREAVFLEKQLSVIMKRFPKLKIVVEHLTTAEGVSFVTQAPENIAATITAHHLLYDRNTLLSAGLKPHYYCMPILKRGKDREVLIAAATGGNPKFFLGTDSAPHIKGAKESSCGCAGCFTAPIALELYAEAFDRAGALDKLEGFASLHGPHFYGLPPNDSKISLRREDRQVPEKIEEGDSTVVPLGAGETLNWSFVD